MVNQLLTLPLARKKNLYKTLVAIPKDALRFSKKKFQCLLGLLRSAVTTISGFKRSRVTKLVPPVRSKREPLAPVT